jgi:hypothetical protein
LPCRDAYGQGNFALSATQEGLEVHSTQNIFEAEIPQKKGRKMDRKDKMEYKEELGTFRMGDCLVVFKFLTPPFFYYYWWGGTESLGICSSP